MKKLIFIQDEDNNVKVYTSKFNLIGKIIFNKIKMLWVWQNIPSRYLTLCRLNEVAGYMKRLEKKKPEGLQK